MSNTSDDNSTNESLTSSSNSSTAVSNPIAAKANMLRPSTLLSAATGAATGATSSTAAPASAAPKSFLRPASFQLVAEPAAAVDGDAAPAATDNNGDTRPSSAAAVTPSTSASAGSAAAAAANPFLLATMRNGGVDDDDDDVDDAQNARKNGDKEAAGASTSAAASRVQPTNGLARTANLFKTANPTIPTTTAAPDFVFGQNVHERVTIESINSDQSTSGSTTTTASSNQLFALAASNANDKSGGAGESGASGSGGTPSASGAAGAVTPTAVESLSEAARQYEESRAQKRKYEEVETFTGEEDELNVMDVNCKLFAFVASNWEERGPGNLRVNDNKDRQRAPRVVFRTSGNLRVLLNTKIWPGMVVERPSQKSMRFSAIDVDGQIRMFLAMARPDDISILLSQLTRRINMEKQRPVEAAVAQAATDVDTSYLDPAVVDIQTAAEAAQSVAVAQAASGAEPAVDEEQQQEKDKEIVDEKAAPEVAEAAVPAEEVGTPVAAAPVDAATTADEANGV